MMTVLGFTGVVVRLLGYPWNPPTSTGNHFAGCLRDHGGWVEADTIYNTWLDNSWSICLRGLEKVYSNPGLVISPNRILEHRSAINSEGKALDWYSKRTSNKDCTPAIGSTLAWAG